MMGTQTMIDKAQDIIKWDMHTDANSFLVPKEVGAQKASYVIPMTVLSKYNFPKFFKWKDPNNRYVPVKRRLVCRSYGITDDSKDAQKESTKVGIYFYYLIATCFVHGIEMGSFRMGLVKYIRSLLAR